MAPVHILIVEDEPKVAEFIRNGLAGEHFDVDVARTGGDALEFIRRTTYDLLVLDVMLPDIDGFEVCRRVRDAGEKVPILILSARSLVEDRVRGLNTGADDYLTKPFDYAELSARVRALLRRRHEAALSLLVVADLVLDPATRLVRRGERQVDLTAKEFALLEFTDAKRRPRRDQAHDCGARLGLHLGPAHQRHRCVYQPLAQED